MLPSNKINPFGDDDDDDFAPGSAWGATAAIPGPSGGHGIDDSGDVGNGLGLAGSDILRDTIRKEAVIKDIVAAQQDLTTLLNRIGTVQAEVDKLKSGNSTLQLYIDTVSKQIAQR